jgi:uncharacterized membrane protein
MSEMIVFAFDTPDGAAAMQAGLGDLQKQKLIELDDAAIVVRRPDGKVKVKQAQNLVGAGAFGGAFWGMLIGLLFFMPWLGMAVGAISGALAGRFADVGIDDGFIKEVGATVQPNHSALFILVRSMTEDKVMGELQKYPAKILRTSLSNEDEAKLKAAFGAED